MNNYKNQLEMLDSAYAAEQRRQMLAMKQKADQRRIRLQKAKELKEKLEKERAKKGIGSTSKGLSGLFQRRATLVIDKEIENSELMKKLRIWKLKKKEYEDQKFRTRVAETSVTLGDISIKTLIIKLNRIELSMKDLNKQTKKVHGRVDAGDKSQSRSSARGSVFNALQNRDRAGSVASRGGISNAGGSSRGSRR